MQNACAEIKIRAERRAGEILAEMPRAVAGRNSKLSEKTENVCQADTHFQSFQEVLKNNGIASKTAYRWQTIATLPDDLFEQEISQIVL
jgi:hypothetical protein